MKLAEIMVSGVEAHAVELEHIPAGSIGATVGFDYVDPMWDGMTKTVVFWGNEKRDMVNAGETVTIPAECVARPGPSLRVGVYGIDSQGNATPTLWADLGRIRAAADPSGDESTDPALPVWAQLQEQIDEIRQQVGGGNGGPGTPGKDGKDGGYYVPAVTQPDDNTIQFNFEPSQAGMPDVKPAQVKLPAGPSSGGNVNQGSGLTAEQIIALDNLFKIVAYTEDASDAYAAFQAAFAQSDSGGNGGGNTGGDSGGSGDDTGNGDNTGGGGETSDPEWVETYTIGDNYTSGGIVNNTTGEVDANGSWNTSDFIEVPDGATTWNRVTSRDSDKYMVWYDADKAFLSGTNASYVGAGGYGNGYTDAEGVIWNMIPYGAKYVRVSWRTSATYTSLSFKHNTLMTENVTPEYGKVYYYTVPNGEYAFGDYLRCDGMAYAHARPVKRCKAEFYDANHSLLSTIATTNNNGNNLAIPSNAKYLRVSNNSTAEDKGAGWGLLAFTETEVTTW